MTVYEWARRYRDHDWQVVPLAPQTKRATTRGWPEIDFTPEHFAPGDNLGLRSVNGLVFVDVDCPEAVQMADAFLPATPTIYGRPSKPRSKRIYRAPFDKILAYKDKANATTLVEIRTQHQDMAPPSVHPDGEPLTWETPDLGTPATVPAEDLTRAVKLLCTAAAIGRHYNPAGSRHDWCLALAGMLRKRGITEADCTAVIIQAATWADDPKLEDRVQEVQSTYAHEDDQPITGARTLENLDHGSLTRTLTALWGVPVSPTAYRLNQRNQPDRNSLANIQLALDRLKVSLRFDLFVKKPFMQYNGYRGLMDEDVCTDLWLDCDRQEHFRPAKDLFFDVLKSRARQDCYHPVREYLGRLTWDGTPRLDTWLIESAGAADIPYTRAVSRLVLIAAVRRVRHPGCKFDEMLVLESGAQGMFKSSALQALCPDPEWFSDDLPLNVDAKQLVERTAGKWIIEASDLSGMRASQVEGLKGMLSRQVDGPVRHAYARMPVETPRQFILIGTTNSYTYLSDQTGNRRFWPVRIEAFDLPWITTHRDQVWAEAVTREAAHVSIRLDPAQWQVTPETARLLQHWRHYTFSHIRPFFCQVEAVEAVIWLTEVARHSKPGKRLLDHLTRANKDANPELMRLAIKLATGTGKTTVMAMLIAWQTINAVRHPGSAFTRGFLVVTPGLTVRDRLRVLQPNDPDSYYTSGELVPRDLCGDMQKAEIVITNYHALKPREQVALSAGGRALLKGRTGDIPSTIETEGQMLRRVMPALMKFKNILAINDEAHHCYREKPPEADDADLKGEEKKEATKNNEAARVWISGLEIVKRKLGLSRVIDLSATPFFLQGSGYAEGTLFPWTMNDFSLMDAIECGIVKLPRVPVAENIPGNEMPMYRNLWEHIRKDMPKRGRGKDADLDPLKLPARLQTALHALYGHYKDTFELWEREGVHVPPCFIIVCQNTAISKLLYDFISGFHRKNEDGTTTLENGRLPLFRNFDETTGNPLARPNTLLIDSEQLEAGDALDKNFRRMAADEINRFRRDIIERTRDPRAADTLTDQDLLREAMNTVGKHGQLGGNIRCVVSVSMLTEGWDANTVTHILGVRAFGTQLLCEQVIGRALRRQSYDLNESGEDAGRFNAEYADIFGIPFDFTAKPVIAPPPPPRETVQVKAVSPDRDVLEIRFPCVASYRVELPEERLTASFNDESILELSPDLVGPSVTHNAGIIGQGVDLSLEHLGDMRPSTLVYHLTQHLLYTQWRDAGDEPKFHLFGQLKRITRQWLKTCLVCKGGTYPAQLMYQGLGDIACERITAGITRAMQDRHPIQALLDPYNPTGSTRHVRFNTSKTGRWETNGPPPKNHVNWVVLDSDWEGEFCRVAESHSKVVAYTKNHNLGFEVPYRFGSASRTYRPDFIVLVDDGHGPDDLLHLVVEIKGYRREDAKEKKSTMDTYWVPGVNNLKAYGRWAFVEFTDMYEIQEDFEAEVGGRFHTMIDEATTVSAKTAP